MQPPGSWILLGHDPSTQLINHTHPVSYASTLITLPILDPGSWILDPALLMTHPSTRLATLSHAAPWILDPALLAHHPN